MLKNSFRQIFIFILCFTGFILLTSQAQSSETSAEIKATEFYQQEDLYRGNTLALVSDNFFRRLFGRKKSSIARERSQSKEHNTSRPQRYSAPPSNSQNPGSYDGNSGSSHSDMTAVRNTPKPALQRSLKEQYESIGTWEMGFTFGTAHSITDVGANKGFGASDFVQYHTKNFSFSGGLYGRYLLNNWFALNMGMNFANLSYTRDEPMRALGVDVYRFNNDIFEFVGKTEFHLPSLSQTPFDIYGYVGIGVLFSDATVYDLNDRLINTQDEYSQVQPFIPFGGGFSVKLTNSVRLGYELGWRNTIFHYLDGVKENDSYDHYFLNNIKIGFTF